MSTTITVAAPPTTNDVAADIIAAMTAQSGVLTDFNPGSQIRTLAEALGSVIDLQGVATQALAFQAIVYSAMGAFGIIPIEAMQAQVILSFNTGPTFPPAVSNILISAGTLVSTVGGVQFITTENATILQGASSVTTTAEAVIAGQSGNVTALTITQLITGLPYPVFVTNPSAATGGQDAETPSQTLARFTAAVGELGASTPVAIANAAIGVSVSGTSEIVKYSTVYEPWIAVSGVSGTAGFTLYIDNGAGTASASLISAVNAKLSGNLALSQNGYRPAGVPYTTQAVTPVLASVTVSGVAVNPAMDSALETAASLAIANYFNGLAFGYPAEQPQIAAAVANATAYQLSSLQVWLLDSYNNSQSIITPASYQRMVLSSSNVIFT